MHSWAVGAMFVAAIVTAVAVSFVTAPYGRHGRRGWGPTISSTAGWVMMEAPASIGFAAVWWMGDRRDFEAIVLLGLWQLHYGYRGFVYPFVRRGRDMPLAVAGTGAAFNLFNAWLNARWVSHLGAMSPWFLPGIVLFLIGWGINQHADFVLRQLRAPGETGYRIPRGGLYRWVSCPNYLGEIVEWLGWAVATGSWAGLGFAAYTVANLAPRALDHHRWYRRTFPDYPPERRALVPGVL